MLKHQQTQLRPFQKEDLALLYTLRNNIDLQSNLLSVPRANSMVKVEEWVQRKNHAEGVFFIIANALNEAIGFIQAQNIQLLHGHAELGICLSDSTQGKGHGYNAYTLLEAYLRDVFNLRKMILYVRNDNASAIAFYHKLNFQEVGVLRGHFYYQQTYYDVLLMEKSLLNE